MTADRCSLKAFRIKLSIAAAAPPVRQVSWHNPAYLCPRPEESHARSRAAAENIGDSGQGAADGTGLYGSLDLAICRVVGRQHLRTYLNTPRIFFDIIKIARHDARRART